MCQYLSNEEIRPPFTYLLGDQECSTTVNIVFGNVLFGSTLAYQLTDLKPNKTSFNTVRRTPCSPTRLSYFPPNPYT